VVEPTHRKWVHLPPILEGEDFYRILELPPPRYANDVQSTMSMMKENV